LGYHSLTGGAHFSGLKITGKKTHGKHKYTFRHWGKQEAACESRIYKKNKKQYRAIEVNLKVNVGNISSFLLYYMHQSEVEHMKF
jgi:hypothetical protein